MSKKYQYIVVLCLSGASAPVLAAATQVSAQAPAAATVASANANDDQLQEITVTARKTNENLTDVPLAVTALTAKAIEARGITDLTQIAAFTPGLTFQDQSVGRNDRGFKQYIIRGIIPNSALASRQTVTIFVDGAPVDGGNVSGVTDIEQVEVIKGPQSAFFGRSTFAGAINITTRAPTYDWHASGDLSYSSFNTTDFNASIEGGLIPDKLAIRLSGRIYHTDGDYSDSVYPDTRLGRQNTRSLSLSAVFQPTETLRIRAFATRWVDDDGEPANARLGINQLNCNAGTSEYYCGAIGKLPSSTRTWDENIIPTALTTLQSGSSLYAPYFMDHLGLHRSAQQYRVTAEQELGDWVLSGVGAYSKNRWGFLQTGLGADYRNIPNINPATNASIPYQYNLIEGNTQDQDRYGELRLTSPKGKRLSGTLGGNYAFAQTDNLTSLDGAATGYLLAAPHTVDRSNTYGVFGSVRWEFLDKLSVSGEGRYQIDKLYQKTVGASPDSGTFRSFTPRAILEYKPRRDVTIYGSYSEGTRPGEFNTSYRAEPAYVQKIISEQADVQEEVKEEKIKMAEIGFKGNLFNNRVRILVAGYVGWWNNRHVPQNIYYINSDNFQNTVQVTTAGGSVDLHGIELETAFKVTPSLTLEGTFDWAHTRIKQTQSSDALALTGNADPVGNTLPYYPEISASASATYERHLFDDYNGYIRADMQYTGKMYDSEADLAWTKPAAIVNLRVGVQTEKYRLEVFGNNLTNNQTPNSIARTTETLYSAAGVTTGTANGITASLRPPRTVGVRFSVKY